MQKLLSIMIASFTILTFYGELVFAHNFEADFSGGDGTDIFGFVYSGKTERLEPKDVEGKWDWNVGFTSTTSKTTENGVSVTDTTSQLDGNLGWTSNGNNYGGGVILSATPAESLTSFGANLFYGYTHTFGEKPISKKKKQPDEDESPFLATLGFKMTLEAQRFTDSLTAPSRLGIQRPKRGPEITQYNAAFELNGQPADWIALKASWTQYLYDKSVDQFLSVLDQKSAVRPALSGSLGGLATALQGFPLNLAQVVVTLYPSDSWDLETTGSVSINDADLSQTRGLKSVLSHDFSEHWRAGIGAERDLSPTNPQSLIVALLSYEL